MKIAQVTMHYFPHSGGQDTFVEYLHNVLVDSGYNASVIQPNKSNTSAPKHVIQLFRLPGLKYLFDGANWFFFNLMLIFHSKKLSEFDVLICHYPFHYSVLKRVNKKVIVISHGVDWPDDAKTIFNTYKSKMAQLATQSAVVVANDRNYLTKTGIKVPEDFAPFSSINNRLWYIPNCIDIKKYPVSNSQRKNIILVPRNIRKSRGIHLAIAAFSLIESAFRKHGKGCLLVIAGAPTSGKYYEQCCLLAKKLHCLHAVCFIGGISQEQLKNLYSVSIMTLVPSVAYEGTSLSAIESMAVGTPVISSSIGGLADLPTYKADLSTKSLAKAIALVLKNFQEVSLNQVTLTRNTFHLENWKKAWVNVFLTSFDK